MSGATAAGADSRREFWVLAGFVGVCLGVSAGAGLITASSVGTWYPTLQKPFFNPPNWVFAPVWTTLYVAMAIAVWRVWRRPRSQERRTALTVFGVQLLFNLLWPLLFFGWQQIGLALVELVLLLCLVGVNTILFWRIDRVAGALFLPYVLWVGFATLLNGALWILN